MGKVRSNIRWELSTRPQNRRWCVESGYQIQPRHNSRLVWRTDDRSGSPDQVKRITLLWACTPLRYQSWDISTFKLPKLKPNNIWDGTGIICSCLVACTSKQQSHLWKNYLTCWEGTSILCSCLMARTSKQSQKLFSTFQVPPVVYMWTLKRLQIYTANKANYLRRYR